MLKLNTKQKRLPFGGHQYPEYGIIFRGDSFKEVKDKLAAFRLNNSIPAGNPEQEILAHYVRNWPWMVISDEVETKRVTDEEFIQWRDWIHETWRHPPKKLLTTKEATERWNKCLKCPALRTQPWLQTDESISIVQKSFILRRGLDTPINSRFCSCHGWDASVAVYLPDSTKNDSQPDICWA